MSKKTRNSLYEETTTGSQSFLDLCKNFFATKPKEVNGIANNSARYYRSWLLRKVFGMFEFSGIPEDWNMEYLQMALFINGHFTITDTRVGVVPLKCSFYGYNIFEEPTEVIVSNPVLGSLRRKIDVDCALVKLQWNAAGIGEMLDRYSYLLAACDSSIAVNLMNTKVTFIGEAKTESQMQTLESMYDNITMGKPAVFVGLEEDSKFSFLPAKQAFIADMVKDLQDRIKHDFLTEISVMNTNSVKKERMTRDEVNIRSDEEEINIQHWLDMIQSGFDSANKLFGLNLKVERKQFGKNETIDSTIGLGGERGGLT